MTPFDQNKLTSTLAITKLLVFFVLKRGSDSLEFDPKISKLPPKIVSVRDQIISTLKVRVNLQFSP